MKKIIVSVLVLIIPIADWAAAPPTTNTCDAGGYTSSVASCTYGTPMTSGDLYVLNVFYQSASVTISGCIDGSGNTWNVIGPTVGSGNSNYIVWGVPATGGSSSVSCSLTGSATGDMEGLEYTGMGTAGSVLDCSSAGATGNSGAMTSAACTTTSGNDLVVGSGGILQNNEVFTAGSGYTKEISISHSAQGDSMAMEDKNGNSCISENPPLTASISGQWAMQMAAFKTSAPAPCVPFPSGNHSWK